MREPEPVLSVVVVGYRNEGTIVRAVGSVLDQRAADRIELIVVTSGGDRSAELVRRRFPEVVVIERRQRLLPGAGRNVGLASTRAPVVAFLEGDCLAEPGWVAARLALHGERRRAVASAITNGGPRTPAGWAAHYLTFSGRLPGRGAGVVIPPDPAAHGLSVPRDELLAIGGFREDLRVGEDTEAARRLHERGVEILFHPSVRTAHLGPRWTLGMLGDQFRRGARRSRAEGARAASASALLSRIPAEALARFRWTTSQAWRHAVPERRRLVLVSPWLAAGAAANVVGWAREQLRMASRHGRTGAGSP
jgi:GT2 family glycosyltransferase